MVGRAIQISLLKGSSEDALETFRNAILYDFNDSERYDKLALVSPLEAFKEYHPNSLCQLKEEEFAMMFHTSGVCQVSNKVAYIQRLDQVLLFQIAPDCNSFPDGTFKVLFDENNIQADVFIYYASKLVGAKFKSKYIEIDHEPLVFAPTIINVRSQVNDLLRAEFGIDIPEKSLFQLDLSRRLRKFRYQLNNGHDRVFNSQSNSF